MFAVSSLFFKFSLKKKLFASSLFCCSILISVYRRVQYLVRQRVFTSCCVIFSYNSVQSAPILFIGTNQLRGTTFLLN